MRSLERRFKAIELKNPYWSTLIIFNETVFGQNYSEQSMRRWLHKLVDVDDYCRRDLKAILAHTISLTRRIEDDK